MVFYPCQLCTTVSASFNVQSLIIETVFLNKLKNIVKSVVKMILENENISEIDINPLVVSDNLDYYAVDVRIKSLLQKD